VTFRRFIGLFPWFCLALSLVFFCVWRLQAQNVGPITSGRLAWYDYSCKCPGTQLTCATCWKYLRLPPGARIETDSTGASDGILWPVEMLAAPGTANPSAAVHVEVTDLPCAEVNVLKVQEDGWLSVCFAAPSAMAPSPRYVIMRVPFVVTW
jgi:hypothetical protein